MAPSKEKCHDMFMMDIIVLCVNTCYPFGLHCPKHAALHAVKGVGLFLIKPRTSSTQCTCIYPPQESDKRL